MLFPFEIRHGRFFSLAFLVARSHLWRTLACVAKVGGFLLGVVTAGGVVEGGWIAIKVSRESRNT